MKKFKQLREHAGNAVGMLATRDHQIAHLNDINKAAALKHHSLAQAAAMRSDVKGAQKHWAEYHKLINGPVQEGWVQKPPKSYLGKFVKHVGGYGKVTKETDSHVIIHNGLNEYPILKQDITSHHEKDVHEELQEGWTQGRPHEGGWTGRYIKHKGGMGKVESEHSQHVQVSDGLHTKSVMKHDVKAHFKKDIDLRVIQGGIREAFYTDQASWEEDMKEHGAKTFDRSEHRIIAKKEDGDILGAWSVSDRHGITGLGLNVQAEETLDEVSRVKGHFGSYKKYSKNEFDLWQKHAKKRGLVTYKSNVSNRHSAMSGHTGKEHGSFLEGSGGVLHEDINPLLKEDAIVEGKRKKTLGVIRGKTATGQRANPIDTEPTLKLKGKSLAQLRKGGQ